MTVWLSGNRDKTPVLRDAKVSTSLRGRRLRHERREE